MRLSRVSPRHQRPGHRRQRPCLCLLIWVGDGAGHGLGLLVLAGLGQRPGRSLDEIASELDGECVWLVTNDVLPADLVTRNRGVAEAALRPWTPVFTHGDLQVAHVFVDKDEITGWIDWSEAGQVMPFTTSPS